MRLLRFVTTVGVLGLATLVLAPLIITTALAGSHDVSYRMVALWCRMLLGFEAVGCTVDGLERVPRNRPYVVISNHSSHFDGPTLILALPDPVYFVIKRELAMIPLWGWAVVGLGFIAVDRARSERARRQMAAAVQSVRNGRRVLVFAEGTRCSDDGMLPFKKGGFHLAVDAGVPLLPVAVNRSRRILPKGRAVPAPGTIEVVVGSPIPTHGCTRDDVDRLREECRAAIAGLRRRDPDFTG